MARIGKVFIEDAHRETKLKSTAEEVIIINAKAKGTKAERELVHKFWKTNQWVVLRAPGSGSIKYPCPDILAGNPQRKLAIECKSTKQSRQYLTIKEVDELKLFARSFGAEPWIGVRFDSRIEQEENQSNNHWYFFIPEDMERTSEQYVVSLEQAQRRGLLFEELVKF